LIGLRIKKEYGEKSGYKFIFNKWRTDILTTKLFSDYDEERRLLYVAITRARQYLIFTANENYSQFFEGMAKGFEIVEDYPLAVENVELASVGGVEVLEELAIGDYEKQGIVAGVHDLMKYTHPERGKGKAFGNELHDFAHKAALGIDAEWNEPEAEKVRNFIASLNAKELKPEIECSLPIGNNLVRGKIDLVAFYDDEIKIVDYKSDLTDVNEKEYQKQLSVYYHVLNEIYPEKRVSCVLYYVCIDKTKTIEPLPREEIERLLIW
jgi:ATP-dependent exoDNAse (exonuclease V) beta subunit